MALQPVSSPEGIDSVVVVGCAQGPVHVTGSLTVTPLVTSVYSMVPAAVALHARP